MLAGTRFPTNDRSFDKSTLVAFRKRRPDRARGTMNAARGEDGGAMAGVAATATMKPAKRTLLTKGAEETIVL